MDSARAEARGAIAIAIAERFMKFTKQYRQELSRGNFSSGPPSAAPDTGALRQFKQLQKEATQEVIDGLTPEVEKARQTDAEYRASVLLAVPVGKAIRTLLSTLREREDFYAEFRSTKTFKDIQQAAEKYRENREGSEREG